MRRKIDITILDKLDSNNLTFGCRALNASSATVIFPKGYMPHFKHDSPLELIKEEANSIIYKTNGQTGYFPFKILEQANAYPYQIVARDIGLDQLRFKVEILRDQATPCLFYPVRKNEEITIEFTTKVSLESPVEVGLYSRNSGKLCDHKQIHNGTTRWHLPDLSPESQWFITYITHLPTPLGPGKPEEVIAGEQADLEIGPEGEETC